MTTPTYSRTTEDPRILGRSGVPAPAPMASRPGLLHRGLARLASHPAAVEGALDALAVGFVAMAFLTTLVTAEFLFHCVFVILILHGFLFGLRGTMVRIVIALVPLLVYANAALFGLVEPPIELTEWPLMFVIAAMVAWMADMRRSTARRYAGLFREASERLLTVQEDERRRIAGELHDHVGQVLSALALTLDAAESANRVTDARRSIRAARRISDSALAATRDLSHRIRPSRLEERGVIGALADLTAESAFKVGIHAGPEVRDRSLLTPTATVEILRVIQEALANAARHSGASGADVWVDRNATQLLVRVVDEGRGFDRDATSASGIGLAGMQERARLLGGELTVESAPGSGTRVTMSVPLAVASGTA